MAAGKHAGDEVVVAIGTGDWGDANLQAFVRPFEQETGIAVRLVHEWFDDDAVCALGARGQSHVDVIPVGHATVFNAGDAGWLQAVDYRQHDPENLAVMHAEAKPPFGLAPIYYSINITYWRDRFPNGGPTSWADFWDVGRFPGKRALRSGDYPAGLMESALLADGVPADQLYPLDLDRAFAVLDRIKPHIVGWWRDGVDQQAIFTERAVDLGSAFNGRIGTLQKQGLALALEWNEGFLLFDYFVMPRGGPNPVNAQMFMSFLSRPANQARFAEHMPYGPTCARAYDHLDPRLAATLPSHPDNLKRQVVISTEWYMAEIGGVKNYRRIAERWNAWRGQ